MKITLKEFRSLFINEGNTCNQVELWNKTGTEYLGAYLSDKESIYDLEAVSGIYLNVDEESGVPCLCVRLDIN